MLQALSVTLHFLGSVLVLVLAFSLLCGAVTYFLWVLSLRLTPKHVFVVQDG